MATQPAPTDKSERILEAALELFAEQGFNGTAIPQIAKRAGVSVGTIYWHFDSKEAVVNALYRHWKLEFTRAVITELPSNVSHRELFHVVWRRIVDFSLEHPKALAFLETHDHASYLDEESLKLTRTTMAPFCELLSGMARTRVVKPLQPELLISIVFGAQMAVLKAAWQGALTLDEPLLQAAEQCCWEAIRA